jgi:5,10-methylenetetrahydrofolate reductase
LRLSEVFSSTSGDFLRVIEIFPPGIPLPASNLAASNLEKHDLMIRFERLVESVQKLEKVADGFSIPDLKDEQRIHLNPVAVASELRRRTGNEVVPTITLRDSNRQNLLGMVTFAIFAGIENLLVVRGDPYKNNELKVKQDLNHPKNVYDFSKVSEFVLLVRRIEASLSGKKKLCILSPINISKAASDPTYLETIRQREFSGVDVFIAESFFENVDDYLAKVALIRKASIRSPIIHSIFPLKGFEDAIMCVEKFGWRIETPELHNLKIGGLEYGLEMARKRYHGLLDRKKESQGACISSRGNPQYVWEIIR